VFGAGVGGVRWQFRADHYGYNDHAIVGDADIDGALNNTECRLVDSEESCGLYG
jgi:hypothetical protein